MKTFFEAVKAGRGDEVKAALERSADLARQRDEASLSPILVALYHGHADVAHAIAERVPDLDIFEAAALGDMPRVRQILGADSASANTYNVDGFTPLGLAAFFKRRDAVPILLAAGADPNAPSRNRSRFAPLHSAAATNGGAVDLEIVRALIAAGADVNARSGQGTTALHTAAFVGDGALAGYLLAAGGDRTLESDDGETPGDIATQRGHANVAALLKTGSP